MNGVEETQLSRVIDWRYYNGFHADYNELLEK